MKRKLLTLFSALLAVLMLGSAFAIVAPVAASDEEIPIFYTSTPNYLYDFTTETVQNSFSNTANMTVSMGVGFTKFTATGSDPQTWIEGCLYYHCGKV